MTAEASITWTGTLAVEVRSGSVPDVPPPDQVTRHVIVAVTVYVPPALPRDGEV
ncbi:hypothetical protein [Micromonospora sp. Llam0]|uniref:hypothetical protein n=1 Tax=Micromonospora sp. Llam0 TaxID=2485143 RepID=UPI0013159DC6|nr:hypothetical protein [Micromonospora sp. Llam0]